MGSFSFTYSNRPARKRVGEREQRTIESRKRFQCDRFAFWHRCTRDDCRKHWRCAGDPFDCFRRHHPAMPRDYKDWRSAEILSRTTGIATAEQALRALGLPMPRSIRPERRRPPPPRRADQAATAVVSARESETIRRVREVAELLSKLTSDSTVNVERDLHELGKAQERAIGAREIGAREIGAREIEPQPAGLSPPRQADEEAVAVVPERTSPASTLRPWDVRKGMDRGALMARLRELGAG